MGHDQFGGLTGRDLEGFHNGGDTELWRRLGSHVVTLRRCLLRCRLFCQLAPRFDANPLLFGAQLLGSFASIGVRFGLGRCTLCLCLGFLDNKKPSQGG